MTEEEQVVLRRIEGLLENSLSSMMAAGEQAEKADALIKRMRVALSRAANFIEDEVAGHRDAPDPIYRASWIMESESILNEIDLLLSEAR